MAEMRAAEAERVMEAAEADQLKIVELETHITQLKAVSHVTHHATQPYVSK